jgi:hypothetical protein
MSKFTPSMAVAVIALVFACSGGAYAASSYITTKQIKDGTIKGKDIASATIGPSKLSDGVQDTLDAAATPGPAGPAGAPGPAGPAGPAGPSVVNALTRVEAKGSVGPGQVNGPTALCPAGQGVVSGGFITAGAGYVFTADSFGGRGWAVGYDNYGVSISADVSAVAYCAPVGQAAAPRAALTADGFGDALATQRATHR